MTVQACGCVITQLLDHVIYRGSDYERFLISYSCRHNWHHLMVGYHFVYNIAILTDGKVQKVKHCFQKQIDRWK